MKRKTRAVRWLLVWMAALCMAFCAVGCGHDTAEVRYRYYSEEEGSELVTADFSEFELNVDRTLPVMIVYTPDYDPYVDRNADNAVKKEYYQSRNLEFLNSTQIDRESEEYEVIVDSYSPTVMVCFEDFSAFERYRTQFVDDCLSNKLLRSVLVAKDYPLEEQ